MPWFINILLSQNTSDKCFKDNPIVHMESIQLPDGRCSNDNSKISYKEVAEYLQVHIDYPLLGVNNNIDNQEIFHNSIIYEIKSNNINNDNNNFKLQQEIDKKSCTKSFQEDQPQKSAAIFKKKVEPAWSVGFQESDDVFEQCQERFVEKFFNCDKCTKNEAILYIRENEQGNFNRPYRKCKNCKIFRWLETSLSSIKDIENVEKEKRLENEKKLTNMFGYKEIICIDDEIKQTIEIRTQFTNKISGILLDSDIQSKIIELTRQRIHYQTTKYADDEDVLEIIIKDLTKINQQHILDEYINYIIFQAIFDVEINSLEEDNNNNTITQFNKFSKIKDKIAENSSFLYLQFKRGKSDQQTELLLCFQHLFKFYQDSLKNKLSITNLTNFVSDIMSQLVNEEEIIDVDFQFEWSSDFHTDINMNNQSTNCFLFDKVLDQEFKKLAQAFVKELKEQIEEDESDVSSSENSSSERSCDDRSDSDSADSTINDDSWVEISIEESAVNSGFK